MSLTTTTTTTISSNDCCNNNNNKTSIMKSSSDVSRQRRSLSSKGGVQFNDCVHVREYEIVLDVPREGRRSSSTKRYPLTLGWHYNTQQTRLPCEDDDDDDNDSVFSCISSDDDDSVTSNMSGDLTAFTAARNYYNHSSSCPADDAAGHQRRTHPFVKAVRKSSTTRLKLQSFRLSTQERKCRLMRVQGWSDEYLEYQERQQSLRLKIQVGIQKHHQLYEDALLLKARTTVSTLLQQKEEEHKRSRSKSTTMTTSTSLRRNAVAA